MNYAGFFDFGMFGNSSSADESASIAATPAPASAIIIEDAQLLFGGDFARRGADLVLSKDGHDHVVADYFKGAQRKALSSPDGATLSPDLVKALVGEVQLAQAGGAAAGAAQVIGSVSKLAGSATAIRNGVSVMLNVGDNVQKGDVVQAGADSSLTLTFIDGTVFGLSANARMVLNEMVYDPQGSSNSSLLSLIQGTITFVAGETAHNGNMRVDTPVATMGIRGTAVLVEIGFEVPGQGSAPPVKFQVLVEPNGRTGSYVLYNKNTGAIMGTVNQAGQVTSITGGGDLSVGTAEPLSSIAQSIIQQTLQQYFPSYVPNANPRSSTGGGGSTPSDPNSGTAPDPLKFAPPPEAFPGQPFQVPINLPGSDINTPPINVTITRFNSAPTVTVTPVVVVLPQDQTSFEIGKQVTIIDPDAGDVATPYVPGSARIISATGPNGTPAALDLKSLVTVDPQTGHVTYDPTAFKFLGAGQKAIYVIEFDSQSGPDTTHQTLTFTVDGTNDAPVVTAALTGAVTQGQTVQSFDLLDGASDPDLGETATLAIGNVKYSLDGSPAQAGAPAGVTLSGASLHVDPAAFAYLGEGQTAEIKVTYTITDAQGASVTQTEMIIITGVNDAPVLVSTNFTVTPYDTVNLTPDSFTVTDPDDPSGTGNYTFFVSNVSGGYFVVDPPPGQNLRFAAFRMLEEMPVTKFTTADLAAGRVHFVSDGSGPPSFSVVVDDGSDTTNSASDATPQTAGYDTTNRAPTVEAALTDTASEGSKPVTRDLLDGAVDADHNTLSIDKITYKVNDQTKTSLPSGLTLDGTLLTIDPNNRAFDYLKAGQTLVIVISYVILDGKGGSVAQTETVTITGTNDAPDITCVSFKLREGGTTVLKASDIGVSDSDSNSFTFTVSDVENGEFQVFGRDHHWHKVTSFTSSDLAAGKVRFVHDGSESDATFTITANDGEQANNISAAFKATIDIDHVNDAPKMVSAPLAISEGGTVVLKVSNFVVTDPDDNSFTFTVSNVQHGVFKIWNGHKWVATDHFTTADLNAGRVTFTHDGSEIAPSYKVTADDGHQSNHASNTIRSSVTFTHVNDAPVIVSSEATGDVVISNTNLVINGGFETGTFKGWWLSGNTGYTNVGTYEHSGSYAAHLGPIGSDGKLTQHITTTPGQIYTLDFWLQHDGGYHNDFDVVWNNATILSLHEVRGQNYTHYTYQVAATGTSTDLVFEYRQDPAYWNLDDVTLRANSITASGKIAFTDSDTASGHTASYAMTNGGAGYIGNFALTPLTENNGAGSVGWTFKVNATTSLTKIVTQSYDITIDDHQNGTVTQKVDVTIGTQGSDNFSFKPGMGTDVIANFTTNGAATDHLNLSAFGMTNTQLQQILHENSNHDAVFDFGHGDSLTLAGVTVAQAKIILNDYPIHV